MLPAEVIRELEQIKLDPVALGRMFELEPQVDCPVTHHFGPGLYIRSVEMKAGDFLIGHSHKAEHTVIVLSGQAVVFSDAGVSQFDATHGPSMFTGSIGHKAVQCLSDCRWMNIFQNPDNCRDIDTLEARYLDKSDSSLSTNSAERDDSELADIPDSHYWRLSVRQSPIDGFGLFLSVAAQAGELIAPATVGGVRTVAGKYVNHSQTPNCEYQSIDGETWLVAIKNIEGAKGGSAGDELTIDYAQSLEVLK